MIVPITMLFGFVMTSLGIPIQKIGYFWHITDIHYDANYSENGDIRYNCHRVERSSPVSKPSSPYGDHRCDTPWKLVKAAAETMRDSEHTVEFVLWTGDGITHSAWGQRTQQLEALSNLTDLLASAVRGQFIFPGLGHDDPSARGSSTKEPGNFSDLVSLWRPLLPEEALTTFEVGGYYSIEQKVTNLRIAVLNTNLWTGPVETAATATAVLAASTATPNGVAAAVGAKEEPDPGGQWAWLRGLLAKCRSTKKKVFLAGHVAPGVDERAAQPLSPASIGLPEPANTRYLRLVREYADVIAGQFFGHRHSDAFRVVYNDHREPVSWILLSPSISPRETASGRNNPGLRLYRFNIDTGQVLDYVQYYLNLSKANPDGVQFQPEYNVSILYGLKSISPDQLHKLAERLNMPTDFSSYYMVNSVSLPSLPPCDATCVRAHYCAATRLDYEDVRECRLASASPQPALRASPSTSRSTRLHSANTSLLPFVAVTAFAVLAS